MSTTFTRTTLTREAIVVGAGVTGLSTAFRLLKAGFRVKIVTKDRTPKTTSDIAAAVWYPSMCGPPDRALLWSRRTLRQLKELSHVPETGVTMVTAVDLHKTLEIMEPWWKGAADSFRWAEGDELARGFAAGHAFTTPVIEMPVYMKWLEARVTSLGCAIETRNVTDLDALLLGASVVVNCTGLGAKELAKDEEVFPIKGQIVRVEAGHASRVLQAGGAGSPLTYVIPRSDCTILGGTEDEGNWSLNVDPAASQAIVARCRALEPALGNAKVLSSAVGLRPGRREVRLETVRGPGGVVIHNYGHGGSGVTLSWGCADEVVRRAQTEIPRQ
jgi:D-amino-acid oxidase